MRNFRLHYHSPGKNIIGKILNRRRPNTDPCGTPVFAKPFHELCQFDYLWHIQIKGQ